MTAYCTFDDIQGVIDDQTILDFLDDSNSGDIADNSLISNMDSAISGACGEVDFYASVHHDTPFLSISDQLRQISTRMTVCRIFLKKPHIDIPPGWEVECQRVYQQLDDIAEGKFSLVDVVAETETDEDSVLVHVETPERTFTSDKWDTY